jgi:hypothetical protein
MFMRIYSIHIFLATIFLLNGCGAGTSQSVPLTIFSNNAAMKPVQDISPAERNIATSICLALKSKSQNFKTTNYLGTRFVFESKQKTCGVQGVVNKVISSLSMRDDGSFHYTSSALNFKDFAQTNSSGYLMQICSKIDNNAPISNTTTMQGIPVQIMFFKDYLEGYAVQYFANTTSGTSHMLSAETFKIRTQLTYTIGNVMGMDEYYSKEELCASDSTLSSVSEQSYIGR